MLLNTRSGVNWITDKVVEPEPFGCYRDPHCQRGVAHGDEILLRIVRCRV